MKYLPNFKETNEMPESYRPALSTGVYGGYSIEQTSEKKDKDMDKEKMEDMSIPYGSWTSPLTSQSIANTSISIKYLNLHKSTLYFVESRPTEKGRNVITTIDDNDDDEKKDDDTNMLNKNRKDITPKELNSGSGVHEYGGNPYIILQGGDRYLSCNWDDGKLYIIDKKGETYKACTNEYNSGHGKWLYADMIQNPTKPNIIYAVREQHNDNDKPSEVVNCLVCIDIDKKEQNIIASGNTFYSYPRISPDGCLLANMQKLQQETHSNKKIY